MKRLLFPAVCIFFILTSCKKKNDVVPIPVGTLSATVGGKNINFDAVANYSIPAASTIKQLNIASTKLGKLGTSDFILNYNITISPVNGIVVKGTYTNAGLGNHFPFVTMDYIVPEYLYLSDTSIQSAVVTITSITDTNVQGTFTGTLYKAGDHTNAVSVINGKFNANIRQ